MLKTLQPSFIFKKSSPLYRKSIYKHPLFTTLLLILTVGEVYNNSNKYQLLNKSQIMTVIFLQNRRYIRSLFQTHTALSFAEVFKKINFASLWSWQRVTETGERESKFCEIFDADFFNKLDGDEIFLYLLKHAFKLKPLPPVV